MNHDFKLKLLKLTMGSSLLTSRSTRLTLVLAFFGGRLSAGKMMIGK